MPAPSKAGKKRKVVAKRRLPTFRPPPSERPSRLRRLLQWVALGLRLLYYTFENGVGLNPAIGAAAGYVFNLNSLHDPNTSGVGHQPTGFDQLIAIYEQLLFTVSNTVFKLQTRKLPWKLFMELPLLISPVQ